MRQVEFQSLKKLVYGSRKALGAISGVVFGYLGTTSIVLITKSAKIVKYAKVCHEICSVGLDIAKLCAGTPIHVLEILIFGRPVILDKGGFSLFQEIHENSDPLDDLKQLFKK